MSKKIDGVIEAIRYKNGQIVMVRAYERRGHTFSDHVILNRKSLIEKLQKGLVFVVGTREDFKASTFKTGKQVKIIKQADRELLSTSDNATRDELEAAPVF